MKNKNTALRWILQLFLAVTLCVTMQGSSVFAAETGNTEATTNCTHTWDNGKTTKQAKCTEAGVRTYTCTKCAATKTEELPARGHSWNSGRITQAATCYEPGITTYTCTRTGCEETRTEEIPINHLWDYGTITTKPTCDKPGVKSYICRICKETKTEEIPALGTTPYWYKSRVTKKPTCTTTGIQEYRCLTCDERRTEEIPIDKDAHKWTSKITKPTKTKKGACTIICELCKKEKETSKLLLGKIYPPMNCGNYAEVYSTSIPKNVYLLSQMKRNTEVYVYENVVVDNNFTFCKILYSHSDGTTAYVLSSYISILTDETRAPDRVTWGKTVTSSKTITLNWQMDDYATGYQIIYATNGKFKGKKTININKGTTVETTIKNLKPNTGYCVKIRAYRKVNGKKLYGPYSKMLVPRTKRVSDLPDEKRAPDRVKWGKTIKNRKKIILNWKRDDYATGYQIIYATNSKFKGKKTININKGTRVKATIKNLKPNTNYYVKIRAYRKVNGKKLYGSYSWMMSPKTKK